MAFRESNALHLEILETELARGVPIEVDIFDGASPGTLLATLENAKDVTFQEELSAPGSGSFRINRHDPKATSAIVDRENLAKIKLGGVYRFSFWMRERKIEVLQEGEQEAEYWTIGGPGALAMLDRAVMWTESYIGDDPVDGVWDLGEAGTGNAVGQMAYRVLSESLAKPPVSPLEGLTANWDYDADSQGASWTDDADLEVNVGDNVLDIFGTFVGLGLDIRMRHDLLLEAFVELGRHFDVASSPLHPVVFRGGQNVTTSLSRRSQGGLVSRVLVKGSGDLIVQVQRPDIEADPYVGRREIFLSVSNAKNATTMQRAGMAELAGRLLDTEAISFGVHHGIDEGELEPYVDYRIGDWITLDEPGVYDLASYRIVGWSIKQSEDDYDVYLDCNSIELEALLKLARKAGLDKAGGSTGGSSTVQGGGGGAGGGGTTSSSSKVAVATGDTPGYLYDKIQEGGGITKALVGPTGSRKVELSADVTDAELAALQAEIDAHEAIPHAGGGFIPNAAIVQQGTKGLASGSPASIVLGAAPTVGNVLFLLTGISDGNAITPTQTGVTWTNVGNLANGSTARASIWKGVIGPGAIATITLTRGAGSAFWQAWAAEFSGIDGTVTAVASAAGAAGVSEGTAALEVDGTHIFLYSTAQGTGGSGTPISPLFVAVPGLSNSGFMGYRLSHAANFPVGGLSLMTIARAWAAVVVAVT